MNVNLTFIDGDNKKYVVPLNEALYEKYRPFFKETPCEKEESTQGNPVIRLSDDPPAAVEALVQVLQHDAFTMPANEEEPHHRDLAFLADALLIAARYHLHPMALQALELFDQRLKDDDDVSPAAAKQPAFAADFVAAVQAAYAPDPDYMDYVHDMAFGRDRKVRRERLPELQRLIVDYASNRYEEMLEDEAYGALFEDKEHPFCQDVRRAAKMKRGDGGVGGDDEYDPVDVYNEQVIPGVVTWDAFFRDERFVTIIDRLGQEWVTTRKGVYDNSRFFRLAPAPEARSTFGNDIYKLPDDPIGIEALHRMFEEGVRTWDVPRHREKTAGMAVEWLTHALLIGDAYDVPFMSECVAAAFVNADYLDRCKKPHAIANAVRVIYGCMIKSAQPDERLENVKDLFVGHFAERYESLLQKKVYKELFMDVPEFCADVRKERSKKMGRGEDGADKDGHGADQGVEHEET